MDPESLPSLLEYIHTTQKTSVKLWRLEHDGNSNQIALDDDGLEHELQAIRASVSQEDAGNPSGTNIDRRFVLMLVLSNCHNCVLVIKPTLTSDEVQRLAIQLGRTGP